MTPEAALTGAERRRRVLGRVIQADRRIAEEDPLVEVPTPDQQRRWRSTLPAEVSRARERAIARALATGDLEEAMEIVASWERGALLSLTGKVRRDRR